ncbi:MAG: alcohol dehydrogenase catalytic domain-containing protein [Parcubacteria group bacterium]|nr:alcohol dehydrogenase catalytic domain-containing protein [Parcubacteria group bacterium]
MPIILGHEFCGIVTEVGDNIAEFKVGDRVEAETAVKVCEKCLYYKKGNYNFCPERLGLGYELNGAFTKYCVVRKEIVHFLPDNVDFVLEVLYEPLSCTVHETKEQTDILPGDIM